MPDKYYKYAFYALAGAVVFYGGYRAYHGILSMFKKPTLTNTNDDLRSVSFGARG